MGFAGLQVLKIEQIYPIDDTENESKIEVEALPCYSAPVDTTAYNAVQHSHNPHSDIPYARVLIILEK